MSVIRDNLRYEPDTGKFYWKIAGQKRRLGEEVGCINKSGYIVVRVNGTLYYGHRLAWFIFYGRWPNGELDHINQVQSDNRIKNLREASRRENALNHRGYRKWGTRKREKSSVI